MKLQAGISLLQFSIIIINTSFGAGMLTVPRTVSEVAKDDMWLAVILGGLIFWCSFYAVARLSQYFPKHTCIEYHPMLLGPILGQALNIILLLLLIMVTALTLCTLRSTLKLVLLDSTPPQMVVAVFIFLLVYATQYGFAPLMRLQQFILMSNYCLLIPLLLLGLLSINTDYYQPVMAKGVGPVIKGVMPSWLAYTGPEMLIGLIYPFIIRQKQVVKWGTASITFLVLIYMMITLIVQGILGPKETASMLVPTLLAYREVEIPDTFIERLDGYLAVLWIPLFFTSLINLFYFSAFSVSRMFKIESNRSVIILLVPILFYLANVMPNMTTSIVVTRYFLLCSMVWGLGIVPLLLGIAWLKAKRQSLC